MRSLLQQLENNESVLLLYLADELLPEDRAEVEQMLATDVSLRREFECIQSLHDTFTVSMNALDGLKLPATSQGCSARKISQMMARQAVLEAVRPVDPGTRPERRRLRLGGWMYPVAVAAAILIAVGWWGRLPWRNPSPRMAHHEGNRTSNDGRPSLPDDLPVIPLVSEDVPPFVATGRSSDLFELTSDGDADRSMVAVAAASVDVSFMFDWDADAKDRFDNAPQ